MRRLIYIILIAVQVLYLGVLHTQLTDKQVLNIYKDVQQVIEKIDQNISLKLSNNDFVARNRIRTEVKQALKNNDIEMANSYFSVYASILDTLVMTNPIAALEIINELKSDYANLLLVSDDLLYYSGAAYYFLGLYDKSKVELGSLIREHPLAPISSDGFTLLLKSYLKTGDEDIAYNYIEASSRTFNSQQNYLAGHVCFSLDKDILAHSFFSQVGDGPYKDDANNMIELLQLLQEEPIIAKEKLIGLLSASPSNPFLNLAMARICSLISEWESALDYYSRYSNSIQPYKEFQVQYELATTHLNLSNKQKALEVLERSIDDNALGEYISPLLFLWSEIMSNDGKIEDARTRSSEVSHRINENSKKISDKIVLINRLNDLRSGFTGRENIEQIGLILHEVNSIDKQLDSINSVLVTHPEGLPYDHLNKWILIEKQLVLRFTEQLGFYLQADELKSLEDTLHINQLNTLTRIYQDQMKRIDAIRTAALKLNDANAYLAIRNEIDNNIKVLDDILNSLYRMKASGQSRLTDDQIDAIIASNERTRAETSLLLDYYDYDNSEYRALMQEVKSSNEENAKLLASIDQTANEFNRIYPQYVSNREKKAVLADISNLPSYLPEYTDELQRQISYLDVVKVNLEYVDLHIAFVETNYYDRIKRQQEPALTFEQSQKLYEENLVRKRDIFDKLQPFVIKYSSIDHKLNVKANPNVNVLACAYFAMAELGNSIRPDQMEVNLANYRKVLELDPKFYLADAVLYNIGYLSSVIAKNAIETGLLKYETSNMPLVKPLVLRYTEDKYAESIEAYKLIIDEYPGSQYYSESIYRLGYLYFEIGTDADRPVEYYAIARDYYNLIIDDPNDPYKYKALYQRGWAWLNSSSEDAYKRGIDDFITILNAIDSGEINDNVEVVDYSIASVKNIGYCLIGMDGTDTVNEAKGALYVKDHIVGNVGERFLNEIIDEASDQKLKLYIPLQSIDYMNVKIDINPLALDNPIIADSICSLCRANLSQIKRGTSPESYYIGEREKIIRRYGLDSEWYAANQDKDIDRHMDIVSQAFADLEKYNNNLFVDDPTYENFEEYLSLTNEFQRFEAIRGQEDPDLIQSTQTNVIAQNLKLAQLTGSPEHYLDLAARIYTFNDSNPDHGLYFDLEETAYECARIICDSMKTDLADLKSRNSDLKLYLSDNEPQNYFMAAAQRFVMVLLSDKFKSAKNDNIYLAVIARQAEIAREKQQYDLSTSYYQQMVAFEGYISPETKRTALIRIAENYEAQKNFAEAEKYYKQAEPYALNKADKEMLKQYALLQIQNSADTAKAKGDNQKVAQDYLRIAEEYSSFDKEKSLQYKGNAQVAFLEAGDYQKSIDLLLEMGKEKSKAAEALNFYRLAWNLADSVGLKASSESVKVEFTERFPASYEAYQVKLALIDQKAADPKTIKQAADLNVSLYEDVVQKRINAGSNQASDIYLSAISLYDRAQDDANKEKHAERFITTYPNHPATLRLMEYLADTRIARDDKDGYEQIAKAIFLKDKTNQSRYANVAKEKLRIIVNDFNRAYATKDWSSTRAKMEEFKKTHAAYQKEGLNLDFEPVYVTFKEAETEYREIEARQNFLKQYDQMINGIEIGFLAQTPDQLLRVNQYTKWRKHIVAGENRIQYLKNTTNSNINKVRQQLETGSRYDMDIYDRLRGLDTICRIADHSASAVQAQIDKYMAVTDEFASLKAQFRNSETELYGRMDDEKLNHSNAILQMAYPYNTAIYKYYYVPGIRNTYTETALTRLNGMGLLPEFQTTRLPIDDSWSIAVNNLDTPSNAVDYSGAINENALQGHIHTSLTIPANSELVLRKDLQLSVPYEYLIAYAITPYYGDTSILINEKPVEYTYNLVDTVMFAGSETGRYYLIFGEGMLDNGTRPLELRFPNYDSDPQIVNINITAVIDSGKSESTPDEEFE